MTLSDVIITSSLRHTFYLLIGTRSVIIICTQKHLHDIVHIYTVPPDQAQDLTVEGTKTTSISISWKPLIANSLRVQYYLINVNNSMNDDIIQVNTTTNVTFYNVTGLLPGTTYELTVVAVYIDGGASVTMSQASSSVTATTRFTG